MEQKIRLIISYGNPGKKYVNTRSNAGYIALDAAVYKTVNSFPVATTGNWVARSKYMIIAINLDPFTFVVKPRTYKDKFDDTAYGLYAYYKVVPENFYVIYADDSLAVGQYKVERGLAPVPEEIAKVEKKMDSQDFWKVRIGVAGAEEELADVDLLKLKFVGEKLIDKLGLAYAAWKRA